MAKYIPNRTPNHSNSKSSRQRAHQTTVVLDRDTLAYLKKQARINADFNRRLAEFDWKNDDLYENDRYSNNQNLNNYRIILNQYKC